MCGVSIYLLVRRRPVRNAIACDEREISIIISVTILLKVINLEVSKRKYWPNHLKHVSTVGDDDMQKAFYVANYIIITIVRLLLMMIILYCAAMMPFLVVAWCVTADQYLRLFCWLCAMMAWLLVMLQYRTENADYLRPSSGVMTVTVASMLYLSWPAIQSGGSGWLSAVVSIEKWYLWRERNDWLTLSWPAYIQWREEATEMTGSILMAWMQCANY